MAYLNLFGRKVKAKDVASPNGSMQDFVIEHGTKNSWNYRKWNSGIMECWCLSSGKCTGEGVWTNMYAYYCPLVNYYPYQFNGIPALTVMFLATDNGANGWLASRFEGRVSTSVAPGAYQLVRPNNYGEIPTVTLSYYAIGKWK